MNFDIRSNFQQNILRVGILVFNHLTHIVFATVFINGRGADGYGEISFIFGSAFLLQIGVLIGSDQLLVKSDAGNSDEIATFSYLVALLASIGLILLVDSQTGRSIVYLSNAISIFYLTSACLQVRGSAKLALVMKTSAVSLVFYFSIVLQGVIVLNSSEAYDYTWSMLLTSALANFSFLVLFGLKSIATTFRRFQDFFLNCWNYLVSSLILVSFSASFVVANQADLIMLRFLSDPYDVGVYSYLSRVCTIAMLGHFSLSTFLPRLFSEHFKCRTLDTLHVIIRHSLKFSMTFYFIFSLGIFIYLKFIQVTVDFADLKNVSVVIVMMLTIGINVATGLCGFALTMSNQQNVAAIIAFGGAFSNIAINGLLIPIYGTLGAAFATFCSTAFVYLTFSIVAIKRVGINTTVIGNLVNRDRRLI